MAEIVKFHHYEVLRRDDGSLYELGRGAMGITYKAFDTNLRCTVALKVINGTYLNSEVARQRFVREARAAARLSHPNVAAVFHLGEDVDSYFYAMEFISGETVEDRVKHHGPLNAATALEITLQVAKALRAADREGLVHRDIKPANLMLIKNDDEGDEGDTFVKVIDFGLAKSAVKEVGDATVTIAGFVGTPHFASPEQLEEHELDVRSDIYSLGITLWWMLTGKPPFSGALAGIMRDHLQKPPPFEKLEGQSPEVVTLLRRMLEKDPGHRPQNATELRREIEAVQRTIASTDGFATKVAPPANGGVFATQVLTATPSTATLSPSTMSSAPAPTVGVVLSRRYRLLRDCGDTAGGTTFQALDLDNNRLVALKVVHPALLAAPDAQGRIERAVTVAQAAAHPGLIAIYSFERTPEGHSILVSEWVNGFSLLDLLRGRSRLPANEVLRIVEPVAAAVDHAAAGNLDSLELVLNQVLLGFQVEYEVGSHPDFLASPMAEWPECAPKISAVSLVSGNESGTFLPEQTMVPAAGGSGSTGGAAGIAEYPRQLAMIVFELLSGSPPPRTNTPGPVRVAPLPSLSEEGNNVLRRGLGLGGFGSAREFVEALKTGAAGSAAGVPTRAPAPATVPPPTRPAAGPASASKPPIIPILIGVGVVVLGGVAYFLLGGKKTDIPPVVPTPSPVVVVNTPVPSLTPSAAPTPVVTAPPTRVVVAPTPAPSVAPSKSRRELFQAALEEARKTETGTPVEQLNAYLKLAEDFPEQDQALVRLDAVIANLVSAAKTPEARAKRFDQTKGLLDRSANLGSESALLFLADQIAAMDSAAAYDYYKRAAEKGSTRAMRGLGDLTFKGGPKFPTRPQETAGWYRAASDKGDITAKLALAECYREGKGGVASDIFQSTSLLNEAYALEPSDMRVVQSLARAYERGEGVPPSPRKAFELMERAAEAGDGLAIANLGTYYMRGVGVPKPDPRKAVELFKRGIDLNNGFAMFNYAQCLEGGLGVPKNPAEARSYYIAAAERGVPPAMRWCETNNAPFTRR